MIVHGKVIAKCSGIYSKYVVQKDDDNYLIVTVLPNWDTALSIGDTGFFDYKNVHSGDFYVKSDGVTDRYKYNQYYLYDFIRDNKQIKLIV